MVGVDGALALGLHRKHGWKIAALAGAAAALPDWDGVTLLWSAVLYDKSHRVWGHNLFACVLAGIALGLLDYRFDLATRLGRRFVRLARLEVSEEALILRNQFELRGAIAWSLSAVIASWSHLAADIVVSGSAAYSDWGVQVLWPLSNRTWVFPRVRWGDVGITLIFAAGALAMLWRPKRVQLLAAMTLATVALYIAIRPYIAASG
jgi:membrane-bound metal-dependent hydrolase YbcI (DUF457 family)